MSESDKVALLVHDFSQHADATVTDYEAFSDGGPRYSITLNGRVCVESGEDDRGVSPETTECAPLPWCPLRYNQAEESCRWDVSKAYRQELVMWFDGVRTQQAWLASLGAHAPHHGATGGPAPNDTCSDVTGSPWPFAASAKLTDQSASHPATRTDTAWLGARSALSSLARASC